MSLPFLERSEVLLGRTRFPLLGPVQRIPVAPFAAKITIGDYSRDSELVASSWVQSDWSGGLGVETGRWPQDQDRVWYSTCDTRWPRTLALPPQVRVQAEGLLDPEADGVTATFGDLGVFTSGDKVYSVDDSLAPVLRYTAPGPIEDLLVYDGKLYLLGPFETRSTPDLSTWTTLTGKSFKRAVEVGGWLYGVRSDRVVEAWDGTQWSSVGTFPLPASDLVWMFSYLQPDGQPTAYAVTAEGVYVLDRGTGRWFSTGVTWPRGIPVGRGCLWRGEVYLPLGTGILKWNGSAVSTVGPDRDYGLPVEFPELVQAVFPSFGWLLACLRGSERLRVTGSWSAEPTDALRTGRPDPLEATTFKIPDLGEGMDPGLYRPVVVLCTSQASWNTVAALKEDCHFYGTLSTGGLSLLLGNRGGDLVLIRLPYGMNNPLAPQVTDTEPEGVLITPKFDAGWVEIDKVALRLAVMVRVASPDLPVELAYRTDQQEWTAVGVVDRPGRHEFDLRTGSGEFPVFRWVQFRITLRRLAGVASRTPVVEALALSFLRRPAQRYAYQMTLDLSREWRGKTREELARELWELANGVQPFSFAWAGDPEPRLVVISRLQWAAVGGVAGLEGLVEDESGRAAVSVMEV